MQRVTAALICAGLAGCTTFPASEQQAVVEIWRVKKAIECELAAAARSKVGVERNFAKWTVATDLDITLERNFSADGTVTVGIPIGPAHGSAIPKIGGANTDTRQSSLKFGTSIPQALNDEWLNGCNGPNPSETDMGLANWIQGSLDILGPDELVAISYVATFKIEINGGARFGYVLTPVVNTVDAGVGFSTYRNYTTRMSIALTPPIKNELQRVIIANSRPIAVWQAPPPLPPAAKPVPKPKKGADFQTLDVPPTTDEKSAGSPTPPARKQIPRKGRGSDEGGTPRDKVMNNPIILQQLLRNAPTYRQ